MRFSERLRFLLEERNVKPTALADKMGVEVKQIIRLKSGRTSSPHLSTMIRVAKALDMTLSELVFNVDASDGKGD